MTSEPASAKPAEKAGMGLLLALTAYACNASSDTVTKWLSGSYSIFQIIFCLSAVALIFLLPIAFRRPTARHVRRPRLVAARSLLTAATAFTGLFAVTRIPLAEVYAVFFAAPLAIAAIAALALGERQDWRRWCVVFAGFLGVTVALRPGFRELDVGHLAALATMLMYAIQFVMLRHLTGSESDAILAGGVLLAMAILTAPLLPFVYRPVVIEDWGLLLLGGLLVGVTNLALAGAARRAPAGFLAPAQYSLIAWAVLFDLVIFDHEPEPLVLFGALMIILAVTVGFRLGAPNDKAAEGGG